MAEAGISRRWVEFVCAYGVDGNLQTRLGSEWAVEVVLEGQQLGAACAVYNDDEVVLQGYVLLVYHDWHVERGGNNYMLLDAAL